MTLLSMPTLNPAVPAPGASNPANTRGAEAADRADGFAHALDRAAAKREDATARQARERDRPPGAAAAQHARPEPSRRGDGASNGRRADLRDAGAVEAEADETAPTEDAANAVRNDATDVAALIRGPADGARPETAKSDAAGLPAAAAFGQAVAAAARERHAAAVDGVDAPIAAGTASVARSASARQAAASGANPASAASEHAVARAGHDRPPAAPPEAAAVADADLGAPAPDRAQAGPAHGRAAAALAAAVPGDAASAVGAAQATPGPEAASEVGPGREPFGHAVAQAAHERHAAGGPAPVALAGPGPTSEDALPPTAAEAAAATQGAGRGIAGSSSARTTEGAARSAESAPGADPGQVAASPMDVSAPAASAGPLPPVPPQVARTDAAAGLMQAKLHADLHEPVGSPRFAPALGARVVTLVRDGVEQAQVRLNPAELGPIAVHIRIDGTRAEVDFSAAHALTRQALQDAVPALAGALRESGLTLAGGGVFEQPRESRDPAAGATPERGAGTDRGRAAGADAPVVATVRPRARGMVDLFV